MKKIIILVILIAVIAGAVFGFLQWRKSQQVNALSDLQTIPASKGSLVATIGATGQVRSRQSASLDWKTTGTVGSVNYAVGDRVKSGDKLAELAQTSLPQTVILARADLESTQKALDDLYTNAENARIQSLQSISKYAKDVKNAQYQLDNFNVPDEQAKLSPIDAYDRMKTRLDETRLAFEPYKYYPSGDSTRDDLKEKLDNAQADFNVAVKRLEYDYALQIAAANLVKARHDYDFWKNGPQSDDIAAAEARIAAAQATLNQAWIEAPFDGEIALAEPQVGDQVGPNTPAFRLDDLSTLFVDLAVSEVDINQIEVGQEAFMTFDAIRAKEYHGIVSTVDRVGTSNQGVVDFNVTVRLTDADEQVKPGMTAAVNIIVNQLDYVLLVPNRAVRFKDGQQVIYLLRGDKIVATNIKLGANSDTNSEVIEGDLNVGDVIILNPPVEFELNGPPPFVRNSGQ